MYESTYFYNNKYRQLLTSLVSLLVLLRTFPSVCIHLYPSNGVQLFFFVGESNSPPINFQESHLQDPSDLLGARTFGQNSAI